VDKLRKQANVQTEILKYRPHRHQLIRLHPSHKVRGKIRENTCSAIARRALLSLEGLQDMQQHA